MHLSHPRIYRRLIACGHSAATVIEMMIDAKRGNAFPAFADLHPTPPGAPAVTHANPCMTTTT
jgi:hypothetical protein